ncbi:MAG: PLxRFG domain-containing protein [Verrucomicrobiota bacterium]|nr:PLxRFG domain-containing protein [Verrucomicrobiota bacterium]
MPVAARSSGTSWDSLVKFALDSGYTLDQVRSEMRAALPEIFRAAKERDIPFADLRNRLTNFQMPAEIWTDPASLNPRKAAVEPTPMEVPTLTGVEPEPKLPQDPTKRGPTDAEMTGLFQRISQILGTPGRGWRGGFVGLANLPQGLGPAFARAAEAVKPEFVPEGGLETAASIAGPIIGDLPLGLAVGAPVRMAAGLGLAGAGAMFGTAAPRLLTALTVSGVEGAAVGGVFATLNEMAVHGQVKAEDVQEGMLAGAALGVGIHGASEAVSAAWGRMAPSIRARIKLELNELRSRIRNPGVGGRGDIISPEMPGLVPPEIRSQVADGRMSLAEAAKVSFARIQGLLKPKGIYPVEEGHVAGAGEVKLTPEQVQAARDTAMRELAMGPGVMVPEVPISPAALAPEPPDRNPLKLKLGQAIKTIRGPAGKNVQVRAVGWNPASKRYVVEAPDGERYYLKPEQLSLGPEPAKPAITPKLAPKGPELAPPKAVAPGIPGKERPAVPPAAMGRKTVLDRRLNEINQALLRIDQAIQAREGKATAGEINQRRRFKTELSKLNAEYKKLAGLKRPEMPQEPPEGGPEPEPAAPPPSAPGAIPGPAVAPKIPPTEVPSGARAESAYEGDELAALLAATRAEQIGRWQAIQELEAALATGKIKGKKLQKVKEQLASTKSTYEGSWSEVMDAAGEEPADAMRREIEGVARQVPAAIPPTGEPAAPALPRPAIQVPLVPAPTMTAEVITKQRKVAALAEVEAHLAKAKPEKSYERIKEGAPVVEIKIDGGIKVKATKEALDDLRARLKQLPERALLGKQKVSLQKLIYTAARKERMDPLVTVDGGGWITDGRVIIQGEATGGKIKKLDRAISRAELEKVVAKADAEAKSAKLLYYAAQESSIEGVSPVPIDPSLTNGSGRPPLAVFETADGRYVIYDQLRFISIVNRHPDVEWHINKNAELIGRVKGKPVSVLTPYTKFHGDDIFTAEPPLAGEAREAGLWERREIPETEGPLADMEPPPPRLGDLLTGREQQLPPREPPIQSADDKRRSFATTMLKRIDTMAWWERMRELRAKLNIPENVTFLEYEGKGGKGHFDPATGEMMITQDWHNIGTAIHETGHAIDYALGTRFKAKDDPFGLIQKLGKRADPDLERIVRGELKELAQHVRPYYPEAGSFSKDRHWTTYRGSHAELLADWFVAKIVDYQLAERVAPTFTKLWMENLERNPKVAEVVRPFFSTVDNPILKADFGDRSVADMGRKLWSHFKGVDLDPAVKETRRGWLDMIKEEGQRLHNLIATPLSKAQRDPIFAQVYNHLQGYSYASARRETIGLRKADLESFYKLPETSRQRVTRVIRDLDNPQAENYATADELARYPYHLSPDEISAYKNMVSAVRYATDLHIELVRQRRHYYEVNAQEKLRIDREIKEDMLKLGHYFPVMRFGDYVVFARSAADETKIWFNFYKSEMEARREANLLAGLGYTDVEKYPRTELPENFWKAYGNKLSGYQLDMLVNTAKVDRNNPEIQKLLAKAETLRLRDLMHRNWIPGYPHTPENLAESIETFIFSASKQLSKYEALGAARKVRDSKINPTKSRILWDDVNRYISTFEDSGEAEHSRLRHFLYNWELAFKTSFLLNNATQTIQNTWNESARFLKGVQPEIVMGRAYKDAAAIMAKSFRKGSYDLTGFSPLKKAALKRLEQEGVLSGQWTEEMLQERKLPLRHKTDKILGLYGHVSEQFNRLQTGLVALDIAERQGLRGKAAINFAREFIHRTQYAFGPANLPAFISDTGRLKSLTKLLYTFHGYSFHSVDRIMRQYFTKEFDPKVLWRQAAGMFGLAGLEGAPGAGLALWGAWQFGGMDVPMWIRKKFKDKEWIADTILGGLPASALGLDTRRSLGLGEFVPSPRVGQHWIEALGGAALGAPGAIVGRAIKAGSLFAQGEPGRAFENLMPRAISNIMHASRIAQEGVAYPSGEVVVPKEEITSGQILGKAIGYQAWEWSRAYEKRDAKRRFEARTEVRTQRFVERLAKARERKDMKEYQNIIAELRLNNLKAKKERRFEDLIQVSVEAVQNHILKMRGKKALIQVKSAPRQLRPIFREIEAQ